MLVLRMKSVSLSLASFFLIYVRTSVLPLLTLKIFSYHFSLNHIFFRWPTSFFTNLRTCASSIISKLTFPFFRFPLFSDYGWLMNYLFRINKFVCFQVLLIVINFHSSLTLSSYYWIFNFIILELLSFLFKFILLSFSGMSHVVIHILNYLYRRILNFFIFFCLLDLFFLFFFKSTHLKFAKLGNNSLCC